MKKIWFGIFIVLLGVLLLLNFGQGGRVGEMRSESQPVELDGSSPVRVAIDFGAGSLEVAGGAEKLLESDFTYNVAKLKPVVKYTGGKLSIRQPSSNGWPDLRRITEFRNDWDLRLNDSIPMNLTVNAGGGTSSLDFSGLSLSRLDVSLGAGNSTINLNGDWKEDLTVSINAGATDLNLLLPENVGVRIEVDRGPTLINTLGLEKNGNVYTNAAYGASNVTLRIKLDTGIGFLNLEVVEATGTNEEVTNK